MNMENRKYFFRTYSSILEQKISDAISHYYCPNLANMYLIGFGYLVSIFNLYFHLSLSL